MNKWNVATLNKLKIDIIYKYTKQREPADFGYKYVIYIKLPRNIKKLNNTFLRTIWEHFYNITRDNDLPCFIETPDGAKYIRDYKSTNREWMFNHHIDINETDFVNYALFSNSIYIHGRYDCMKNLSERGHIKIHSNYKNTKLTRIVTKIKSKFRRKKFTIIVPIVPINTIKINKYGL